jgi:anaerobic dimethyl sulfoxide reductase subunit C (anchor subunit)
MNVHEWALVTLRFSHRCRWALFIVLGVLHWFAVRKAGLEQADRLADYALLAIGPVLLLGMGASTLHLGTPNTAYRAVANLGSSWLSREILCGTLFAVAGAVFAFLQWRKLATSTVRNGWRW